MENFKYGIWYKNLGINGQYIASYTGILGDCTWKCNHEFIENEKFEVDDTSEGLTDYYEDVIPCLLSEIDHILPSDHPDRTSGVYFQLENIPEKWFVKITSDLNTMWTKYSKNNIIYGQSKTIILEDRSNSHQEITVNQFLYLMAEKSELISTDLSKLPKIRNLLLDYYKDSPIGIHENVSFKPNNFTLINKYNSINF